MAIAEQIFGKYPRCCILFDGFSLPVDWPETSAETRETLLKLASESRREIDLLCERITARFSPGKDQRVVNIGGIGVLDSIALAQTADAYFCHLGTMHHKIGWTTATPGIIHVNRTLLLTKPELWHGAAVEGGVEPAAVAPAMIDDVASGRRNGDYTAVDVDGLACWVVDYFSRIPMKHDGAAT